MPRLRAQSFVCQAQSRHPFSQAYINHPDVRQGGSFIWRICALKWSQSRCRLSQARFMKQYRSTLMHLALYRPVGYESFHCPLQSSFNVQSSEICPLLHFQPSQCSFGSKRDISASVSAPMYRYNVRLRRHSKARTNESSNGRLAQGSPITAIATILPFQV